MPEINTYGLKFSDALLRSPNAVLHIELYCFRVNHKTSGGLGTYGHFRNVCKLLWPKMDWHPWMEWGCRSLCENPINCWTGCAAASKTFMVGVYGMVFWLAEQHKTSVVLTTTTGKMVRRRIWPVIQQLYRDCPGLPGNMVDSKTTLQAQMGDDKNGIFGIAVGDGPVDKAVGNIKGVHNKRMLVVIDEATDTPPGILCALPNLQKGCEDFRLVIIGNATSHMDSHGRACEPKDGWNSVGVDDEEWDIKGVHEWGIDAGICLHFDGEKSPNVRVGEDKWKFIYSNRDLARAQSTPEARETVSYWRETRGFWCPDGSKRTVFNEPLIQKYNGTGKHIFLSQKKQLAALDPAFGGDKCKLRFGELGDIEGGSQAIQLTDGLNVPIKASNPEPVHYQIAFRVIKECKERGIEPQHFSMDASGEGGGLADIISHEWKDDAGNSIGHRIVRVEFGGSASDMPVSQEDGTKSCDKYDRKVTELYFSCKQFLCGGQLKGLDTDECVQFCSREYDDRKKIILDSKKDCKKKIGRSPDDADAVATMIHLARTLGAVAGVSRASGKNDDWKKFVKKTNKVYSEIGYEAESA